MIALVPSSSDIAVIRAVERANLRDVIRRTQADRVEHFARRLADLRLSPTEWVIVVLEEQDEPDGLVCIAAEVALPERVHLVGANRTTIEEEILLTVRDATWLHAVLGELLRTPEDLDLAEVPPQRLIEMHRDLTDMVKQEGAPDGNSVVHAALVTGRAAVVRALAISNARSAARGQP